MAPGENEFDTPTINQIIQCLTSLPIELSVALLLNGNNGRKVGPGALVTGLLWSMVCLLKLKLAYGPGLLSLKSR